MNGQTGTAPTARQRRAWATVIGVFSVVSAGYALAKFAAAIALSSGQVSVSIGSINITTSGDEATGYAIASAFLTIALLASGVGLLCTSRLALLHLPFAACYIILIVLVGFRAASMIARVPLVPSDWEGSMQLLALPSRARLHATIIVSGVIEAAYALFLIGWFCRPRIMRQVLAWKADKDSGRDEETPAHSPPPVP